MTTSSVGDLPNDPLDATLGGHQSPRDSKPQTGAGKNALDNEDNRKLLRQFEEWYEVERIRQAPNRYQQAIDDDFYDGLQWSDEDAQELALRGQAPLVYNKIQPAVKWLTGTEKRTRIDWKILPRKNAGVNEAENKTKYMKYLQDVNKSAYARSRGFEDEVKTGVGWLECGIRGDPTMEPIYDRNESWRNIIYDSQSIEYDLSDARYLFRQKWTDEDIALLLFPKRATQIRAASVYSDFADAQDNEEWYLGQILQERAADGSVLNRRTYVDTSSSLFNRRARVKLIEVWYRRPTNVSYIHGPNTPHHNAVFDPDHPEHAKALTNGAISLYERLAMRMWCAVFIRGTLLQNMISPYDHHDFPFTPLWGNRRGRDRAPYGLIRVARDPQEDFNKRMSKALHSLSSRRVIMDFDATMDVDDVREEAARPDSVFMIKKGSKFELETDLEIGEHHLKYANLDEKAIQDVGGVTDELMGHKTNAVSGKAIEARQDQGSTVTTDYFDNYRLGYQLHGQKILSLMKQYVTEEKEIRVLGSKRPEDFVTINKQMPDGTILNDITQTEADFIVSETDYRATQRQAMFESMQAMVGEIAKVNPQWAMMIYDDVLEFSDIPGTEAIVATIRQMTGKPDPDKRLTPAEKQAAEQKAQQQAQEQAQQQALVQAAAQGNVAKIQAQVTEITARAAKLNAEAQAVAGGGADDGGLAASYNDQVQKLHDDTQGVIEQLSKQILVLERQVTEADQRALNHQQQWGERLTAARLASDTTLRKTVLDNLTKERIASAADRTLEDTGKVDRQIQGLKEQLDSLSHMQGELAKIKLDKPGAVQKVENDPFGKMGKRLDQHEKGIAKATETAKKALAKPTAKKK